MQGQNARATPLSQLFMYMKNCLQFGIKATLVRKNHLSNWLLPALKVIFGTILKVLNKGLYQVISYLVT